MKRFILAFIALGLAGCSVVRVHDNQNGLSVTSYLPAWPWQDSAKAIERLSVYHKTNYTSVNIRGLSEVETTSTNVTALIERVVSAAVRAAVKP